MAFYSLAVAVNKSCARGFSEAGTGHVCEYITSVILTTPLCVQMIPSAACLDHFLGVLF